MNDNEIELIAHLEELRKRLMVVLDVFLHNSNVCSITPPNLISNILVLVPHVQLRIWGCN